MKVTIFGTGYVGLVTGACLADVGNDVICVDIDAAKIDLLTRGKLPFFEPGLGDIVARNARTGRLRFETDVLEAVDHGAFQLIAVGTPPAVDGSADLRAIDAVAASIGDAITEHKLIVIKSTAPVGTADRVRAVVAERVRARGLDVDFDVVSNPEFLAEGSAVDDFMRPDRIIVGASEPRAIEQMRALYAPLNRNHGRMLVMDVRSAEFTKYAANAMLATKVSLMNELANLAESLCVDIEHVRVGIGSDPRIGYDFIYPGCGYGGSCFPKDVRALRQVAVARGIPAEMLSAVESVNERQKLVLFHKVLRHYGGDLGGRTFALWGLAFKPNTDDMREAPSRPLMEALWAAGARVQAYDPAANAEAARLYGERPNLHLCESAEAALWGADALLIATEWGLFRSPDFDAIKAALRAPLIFDGRNMFDPERMARAGFRYYGVGIGAAA